MDDEQAEEQRAQGSRASGRMLLALLSKALPESN